MRRRIKKSICFVTLNLRHCAPHLAFGYPLPEGEGKLYTFSLREKDRMRAVRLISQVSQALHLELYTAPFFSG